MNHLYGICMGSIGIVLSGCGSPDLTEFSDDPNDCAETGASCPDAPPGSPAWVSDEFALADESAVESEMHELGTVEQAIRDGNDVTSDSPLRLSTVSINGGSCTGTIIGTRFVLTAAHCQPRRGSLVTFYDGAFPSNTSALVVNVFEAPGVTPGEPEDSNGDFADFAVLHLDRDIPRTHRPALLPLAWPGEGVTMYQVGVGGHDGYANAPKIMRYRTTLSSAEFSLDGEGDVGVQTAGNPGDSGGPIYTFSGDRLIVHGTNWGHVWSWGWRGKYTSTAFHYDRIVKALGHERHYNWDYPGNDIATFRMIGRRGCISRCMDDPSCKAYTHQVTPGALALLGLGTCVTKSSYGAGGVSSPGRDAGVKKAVGTCTNSAADGICRL